MHTVLTQLQQVNSIMNSFNSVYTSPLRAWLRRLGIVKLATLPTHLQAQRHHSEYKRNRPKSVTIRVGHTSAYMLVNDAHEYVRAMAYRQDQKILQALASHLRPGDVCWDIGANVGLYSVLLAKIVSESGLVVAFEPEPRSAQRLKENLAANQLHNVRPFAVALGAAPGEMHLVPSVDASSGTHHLISSETSVDLPKVTVIAGDELRHEYALAIPVAIKIDVEGMELDVLKGLQQTLASAPCKTVMCEIHFSLLAAQGRGDVPKQIQNLLLNCGFHHQSWIDHSHLLATK